MYNFHARSPLISSKKNMHLLNLKRIDNSTENMSGIIDSHQNYEKCDCKVRIVIGASKKETESKI